MFVKVFYSRALIMTSKQLQDVFMRVMLITDCHLAQICHKAVCVCAHIALHEIENGLTSY